MTAVPSLHLHSELDGEEPGGFIIVNLEARMLSPYQVMEDDGNGGAFFQTLTEARRACQRFRIEEESNEIYVYALVGVREAIERHPSSFQVA